MLQSYTQYIPLSVYDLQSWMGAPSIYVYDCSNAGIIVDSFKMFAQQHENEYEVNFLVYLLHLSVYLNNIHGQLFFFIVNKISHI